MSRNEVEPAPLGDEGISKYFEGKTVFLTGGTGFLGKLIVEKLLRACPGVRKIYLLIRMKKGVEPHERLKEAFDVPAFEPLKAQSSNFLDKLSVCIGDCALPSLGLSSEDKGTLKEEVNCVLHCAATVRFDASLKKATHTNVRAVKDLLKMAKEMKRLTSFVYVSTAYANCPRADIDEVFYAPPITGKKLMDLVETQEDELIDIITPTLLSEWPNTYSFTKAVAEDIVKTEAENLPMSVVRPSIITAAHQEPLSGWVDNIYGISGLYLGLGLGLIRIFHCDKTKVADIVPVDYVVNAVLAAAWNSSQKFNDINDGGTPLREIPIYNYVSGPQNPLTWSELLQHNNEHIVDTPISISMWYVTISLIKNKHLYLLMKFLLHTVPAYIIDFVLLCLRKQPMLAEAYKKIDRFSAVVNYFGMREWRFKNDNTQKLWRRLTSEDKALFNFDISKLVWRDYCKAYVIGFRVYLLKDPLDTLPKARQKFYAFKAAHYALLTLFWLGLFYLVMLPVNALISP